MMIFGCKGLTKFPEWFVFQLSTVKGNLTQLTTTAFFTAFLESTNM